VAADLWIFGYGSLVWRPGFAFAERRTGFVAGYARRFWQGSTDHRGVPEAPGRVVTLTPCADSTCWGVAYRVAAERSERTLRLLDHRERGGFDRTEVDVTLRHPEPCTVRAVSYVATPSNGNYLGAAPLAEIAEQVRRACGPSGPNSEYVLRLAAALRGLGVEDDHVLDLAALLQVPRVGRAEGS